MSVGSLHERRATSRKIGGVVHYQHTAVDRPGGTQASIFHHQAVHGLPILWRASVSFEVSSNTKEET